jgi:hypothetical protein
MKKALYMDWALFTARSFDGRWWGWILNEAHDFVFCGRVPAASVSPREAQQFVWQIAKERRGGGAVGEPEWMDMANLDSDPASLRTPESASLTARGAE